MKKIILLIFIFLNYSLIGQVVINDSTFPMVGDTLYETLVNQPDLDLKENASGETNWDFSNLPSGPSTTSLILNPSISSSSELYPNADFMIIQQGLEFFYDVQSDKIVEIGAVGPDPILNLLDIAYQYEGERIYRRAPIHYLDETVDTYDLTISEAVDNLPEEIKSQISFLGLDSIRLVTEVTDNNVADAYGELKMPGGTFDVLRVKTINLINSELYAYQSLVGWVPLPPSSIPIDGVEELLGIDTVTQYNFYTNDVVQPLVTTTLDNRTPDILSVNYRTDRTMTSTTSINAQKSLTTFPNPTFGDISFQLNNYPIDNYRIDIYNIIGKKLDTQYFKPGQSKLKTNLSHLKKGTYLYSVINSAGKKMVTKRLIIITP